MADLNKNVTILSTQTLFDVALQLYGSADAVFDVIDNNSNIENLETDLTQLNINYKINNTLAQRYFISRGITVATKPREYYNSTGGALLQENGYYLLQENGYKILI